jgi:hypothetical protein
MAKKPCTKKSYRTKQEAFDFVYERARKFYGLADGRPYRCAHCHRWHVTSKRARRTRRTKKEKR